MKSDAGNSICGSSINCLSAAKLFLCEINCRSKASKLIEDVDMGTEPA